MQKKFFIIIGRSGSGKGTQSKKLSSFLLSKNYTDVRHVTTGAGFRTFVEKDSYTANLSKSFTASGRLGPEFLAVWNWTNIFIEQIQEGTTVILDGAPRRLAEAETLHAAFAFYGYEKPIVIYLDTSESFAIQNLLSRDREDDATKEDRERKMKWFYEDVLPCVAFYKDNPLYHFIHVNGEKSIDDVWKELGHSLSVLI